ncbi:MAG: type IX secretion system sortase PorU [Bacteroidales bacterium]|nr:type IX secretion system sortase PorU [Bacteroidales bacterium]MCF8334056.1 type IX secretion system sortase PorU [Bacteroidales bacterium]
MRNLIFITVLLAASCLQLQSQDHSLFSQGEWYKITTQNAENVQKIPYDEFLSAGIDIENVNPDKMQLYVMPPGLLPETAGTVGDYPVKEMAVDITGSEDGSFDSGDALLFFPGRQWGWGFNNEESVYTHFDHPYSEEVHYFLRIDGQQDGKRIEEVPSLTGEPAQVLTRADFLSGTIGTGEINGLHKSRDFMQQEITDEPAELLFDKQNHTDAPAKFVISCVWQGNYASALKLYKNENLIATYQLPSVPIQVERELFVEEELHPAQGDEFQVAFEPGDTTARAFVDYMAVQTTDSVVLPNRPVIRNQNQLLNETVEYRMASDYPVTIWDITDLRNVKKRQLLSSEPYTFRYEAFSVRKFFAFSEAQQEGVEVLHSENISPVDYTDLYSLESPDMLIITDEILKHKAQVLADYHEQSGDFEVEVIGVQDIYNNFSGNVRDFSAIRNFIKHLYDKSDGRPGYVLLFGDASYRAEDNDFIVPAYQGSVSGSNYFVTAGDTYFGYVDDGEHFMNGEADMDVSIGRLPVSDLGAAENVVMKILNYNHPGLFGKWKSDMGFIADDEDANIHMNTQEDLSNWFHQQAPVYNTRKVYLDNYPQESGDDHVTTPQTTMAIHDMFDKGVFFMDYLGHTGTQAWASELAFTTDDALELENEYFPLLISNGIGDFFDPEMLSLSEAFVNNPHGTVGVITSTNPTFSSIWSGFKNDIYSNLFTSEDQRAGDVFRASVNTNSESEAGKDYILIGDPALKFSYPDNEILTETINGEDATQFSDTLFLDEQYRIEASVNDNNGVLESFDGQAAVRVFAPSHQKTTLGNDGEPFQFVVTDSLIYQTQAQVEDGYFEFEVALPANYDFAPDSLKISYYASNDQADAAGYYDKLMAEGKPSGVPIEKEIDFTVYPTLVKDILNVQTTDGESSEAVVEIYNARGNKVLTKPIAIGRNDKIRINMNSLTRGMYFVRLKSSQGRKSVKVIKQ